MASWVLSAFRDRSTLLMLTLYKSMVRSRLEYCCPLWNPVKIGDIQKLENIKPPTLILATISGID